MATPTMYMKPGWTRSQNVIPSQGDVLEPRGDPAEGRVPRQLAEAEPVRDEHQHDEAAVGVERQVALDLRLCGLVSSVATLSGRRKPDQEPIRQHGHQSKTHLEAASEPAGRLLPRVVAFSPARRSSTGIGRAKPQGFPRRLHLSSARS